MDEFDVAIYIVVPCIVFLVLLWLIQMTKSDFKRKAEENRRFSAFIGQFEDRALNPVQTNPINGQAARDFYQLRQWSQQLQDARRSGQLDSTIVRLISELEERADRIHELDPRERDRLLDLVRNSNVSANPTQA